jgi:hypothetical protein
MPVYSAQFGFLRSNYMLASTTHWMPLIDGYSDYIPKDFNDELPVLGDFPSREALAQLQPIRARYAVFHVDRYGSAALARLHSQLTDAAPFLRKQYADDHIWLYEIVAFPPKEIGPERAPQ